MNKILKVFISLVVLLNAMTVFGQKGDGVIDPDPLAVIPQNVDGTENCVISLNGEWQLNMHPQGEFWKDVKTFGKGKSIAVPGECQMQGFKIEHDKEVAYGEKIQIPVDFANKKILIRFDGVYSHSRVWINGQFVREHHGGFTAWDCDITKFVEPGTTAWLVVGVTDRKDEISYASGYAKHPIGGILRGVNLVALPLNHLRDLNTQVTYDASYRNASLRVDAALNRGGRSILELSFIDPQGKIMEQGSYKMLFEKNQSTSRIEIPFQNPVKWDAEHPNLYTMRARLIQGGTVVQELEQHIGFREVKVMGNELFVNGKSVKLRGGCRHDIHPLLGRSTNRHLDSLDVVLAKEANLNYIRSSHYPPSTDFLEFCDSYGIYVEEETAICFVNMHRSEGYHEISKTENDPAYTSRYLGQLSEMIDRDRNHPSVIIWSIGNESSYGTNFQKQFDFVKSVDGSRPVKFSYPGDAPKETYCYEIMSMHYPESNGNLNQYGIQIEKFGRPEMPVIHDEWAHVACYNNETLQNDPNVRNFWGESLKIMWDNCFESDGGLGGAIWGYLDESFMLPDTVVGYGQWGIIDTWRRKKPEFWLTKKAYTPVKISETHFAEYASGKDLKIPVYNRFDHTLLNELKLTVSHGEKKQEVALPKIYPHTRDSIVIPGEWIDGHALNLKFNTSDGALVDEFRLTFGDTLTDEVEAHEGSLDVKDKGKLILVKGAGFQVVISKKDGLIQEASVDGHKVLDKGPYVHLTIPKGKVTWSADSIQTVCDELWELSQMEHQVADNKLTVRLKGQAGGYPIEMTYVISSNGEIDSHYQVQNLPSNCQELGVSFVVNKSIDQLSWKRNSLWSVYPSDHIGRREGSVTKFNPDIKQEVYRKRPSQAWNMDCKAFYLNQKKGLVARQLAVTNDFKSMKEYIYSYILYNGKTKTGIQVKDQGSVSARSAVQPNGDIFLYVNNEWNYVNLNWGNYERPLKLTPKYEGKVKIKLLQNK